MDIKKGDNVIVLSGKDKGKSGKVMRVFPDLLRALVESINTAKKHVRPRRQGEKGQVVDVARTVAISKLMLVCKSCGKKTRVRNVRVGDVKKRQCLKCNSSF